ncbi:type II toxin-antitoxin system Phd/YefM family antitoxin [bacterium]|nr:type II toxin-antitoxin system Phd/YefM family antitoxin [bacterium]
MTIYTYSEARQKLAALLEEAKTKGKIIIKRKDGSYFVLQPIILNDSPLDIPGLNIKLSIEEIEDIIREIRER